MSFPASIDLSTLDGQNGFTIRGIGSGDRAGFSVSNIGDVNGDGFDDFIIGAWGGDAGATDSGESYVVFGKANGFTSALDLSTLDGSNGFRLDGINNSDNSGYSVSGAGDINGDGFDDIIIGAQDGDAGATDSGESYVVFGKASGFTAALSLSMLDGTNGFRLDGINSSDSSGQSVSGAGDVNGDGFDDIIIGARGANAGETGSGQTYVVFGKASGFTPALSLSALDGFNGFRLDGIDNSDSSGFSVSGAGDVNGDGFDDIIIGAFRGDEGGLDSGESYVVFGKASGFTAALDLSSLDGSNGFRLDGIDTIDFSGIAVSGAGDVNGDGYDDIIIGAHFGDAGATNSGESYVVFGKASGFTAALDLSSLDGSNGFRLDGIDANDQFGRSVSSAGDVNGDGFDDIIIGSFSGDAGATDGGESYVVFGKASGFTAALNLSTLDGSNGFRLDGIGVNDFSGWAVSGAGDVNGDGYDDILIGAFGADASTGEAYVIFGRTSNQTEGTPATDDNLLGGRGNDRLNGYAGNDRLNGRDGDDIMAGGAGDDLYFVTNTGDVVIELADEGDDTVTSSLSYTLGEHVENLRLRGDAAEGVGNELDNSIVSVAVGSTLRGLGGNDYLRVSDGGGSLYGGDGDDTLIGRNGDDWLSGGAGFDNLRGAQGADTFAFADGDFAGLTVLTADRIAGYRSADGDKIDLSAVDAILGGGDDAFTFVGAAEFSGTAGELRWEVDRNQTMLLMDIDGDGGADLAIRVNGLHTLTEADFIL
ncbi:beta strand repeat-containing protein [Erythrobacter sp. EC-HK427]|uniref:beta strand repeat-containing protein n=1 Tax=Erythrobacter sp. EC-HK427 TaxID=2038396 RepID=UPI0018FE1417|nr:FG-GAP repeat protein [Erythrobacter sp. EC-HK427]